MQRTRSALILLAAAVLAACSSDGTGPAENAVTATGSWSAVSLTGTQYASPTMLLTESASASIAGTLTATVGGGGGRGDFQTSAAVSGTRRGTAVALAWHFTDDPATNTFNGTLTGNVLGGTMSNGQASNSVTFQR